MDQFLAMRAFRYIVEAGGFSAAAERLDTTHSSVSRQLKQLEAELRVQLINRTTRRITLTSAGETYYATCVDVLDRVQAAHEAVTKERQRVAGVLRVSMPMALGTLELAHWLPSLLKRYPELKLDISCSDQFSDLVAEGFDVALRISHALPDSSLMARKLVTSPIVLVAAPAYVARHGVPSSPEQLTRHELLAFSASSTSTWNLATPGGHNIHIQLSGRLRMDAITALHAAAIAGAGIAAFTHHTVKDELARGQLVQVLPDYTLGSRHYYAVYPRTRHVTSRVRAFVDYMLEYYARL
ncbi:LysR family transcriptional regulator [Dyella sp.]|uniref:LysR family transcriptional regulator n=1 Tax=Dyella sp. TaxID=1869338 RepID=UPI002FD9DB07